MADRDATPERGSVNRDREILCILFDATNNAKKGETYHRSFKLSETMLQDGWRLKDGWKSGMAMGEWHGVTTNVEGRVTGLHLFDNDLKGIIPPQLGDLDALEQLNLGKNVISGGIPKELGKVQALKQLDVSHNYDLGGVIPPELGDLKALEELDLSSCDLEGGIPSWLGKLQALKRLDLGGNVSLGGVIPPELGGLKALESLVLSSCWLEGGIPSWLGKLQALKRLHLSFNASLGGIIPPELGDLKALESLRLSRCGLEGCVPPQLGNLQAAKTIDLSGNKLTGLIPPELGGLKALEVLDLSSCGLEGGIPSWLGKLQTLITLDLRNNPSLGGVIPPELGGLKALEELDLSKCRLEGSIPSELGKLQALKRLDLTFNLSLGGIIPPELGDLKALEGLDLSRCGLEGCVPPQLGNLQAVKQIILMGNNLTGVIPPELGGLKALEELDLSSCDLEGIIPPELGDLKALESLRLSFCGLEGCVPPQLGNLQAVKKINLSGNKLTGLWDHTQDASLGQGAQDTPGRCIPSQLRRLLESLLKLEARWTLHLTGNPWAEPPEAVVSLGMAAVIKYFDALYSSPCRIRRNSVKVVLVGQEGAGKTSLCKSMKAGRAAPTTGSAESTIYADVETMELSGASVRVYDCAGQVAYTGLLQMFLTPRAVCVVVCNAEAFGQHDGGEDDQMKEDIRKLEKLRVCDWLRSISYRVPRSDVILVATKCDGAGGNAAGMAQRMGAACQEWLQSWVDAGMAPVRLEDGVCRTSCSVKPLPTNTFQAREASLGDFLTSMLFGHAEASPGKRTGGLDWECDWCDDGAAGPTTGMLHRVMNKRDGSGLRGSEMVLPHSWDIALTVLEALESGRDPVEAVVKRSAEPHVEVERKPEPFKVITVGELNVIWKAAVVGLTKKGIDCMNPDHALEGALSIREFEGTLVRHETFLFLDVVWLTRILKPLLNHKGSPCGDGSVSLGNTGDKDIVLTDERHIDSWNRLEEEGVLEPALARVMWPDLFEYVLPTLASLGLTFPLELDPEDGLVVLLRLGTDRPKSVGEDIDKFRVKHLAVFDVCWDLFLGVPPGVIEKILTRCCSIGAVQTFWRFGVLVQGTLNGSEGSGSFALVLEYSCDVTQLGLRIYGDVCTVAPWAALSYAISAVGTMAVEFPGLRSRASIECPEDGHDTRMAITTSGQTRGPGEKLLQGRGCSRCSPETGGIGAAASELVRLVDVREARGVVFCKVNAWFGGVQRKYDALRPAGSRDLHSETYLSQLKTAEESLLKRMQEYLESVLPYAGAPASSRRTEQDESYPDWEKLQRTVEEILRRSGGLEAKMGGVEAYMGGVAAKMSEMAANMMVADNGVTKTLDVVVAMLMAVRGDAFDTPRQACVFPGDYAPHGLTAEFRSPKVWTQRLQEWIEGDFKAGKGVFKTKMRLFLVCAHTHELVPCGHDGRGYDVQRFRRWVGVAVDVAKFALQVTCTILAGPLVAQLPATALGAVGEEAVRAAVSGIQEQLEGLKLDDNDDGAAGVPREEVETLQGKAYNSLRTFVHEMEDTARLQNSTAGKKARRKGKVHPSNSDFVFFEDVMTKVQARTGDGDAQWVLPGHEQAWREAAK